MGALTYFQPRVVLQLWQKMSATECSPVSSSRCSAGPQPTFTLRPQSRGGGCLPPAWRNLAWHSPAPPGQRPWVIPWCPRPRTPPAVPPPWARGHCPWGARQYSHGVEQVGTAMAALEGLWGHGTSHWLGPVSPGPPASPRPTALPPCNTPARGHRGGMLTTLGTPWGDTSHASGTTGEMLAVPVPPWEEAHSLWDIIGGTTTRGHCPRATLGGS